MTDDFNRWFGVNCELGKNGYRFRPNCAQLRGTPNGWSRDCTALVNEYRLSNRSDEVSAEDVSAWLDERLNTKTSSNSFDYTMYAREWLSAASGRYNANTGRFDYICEGQLLHGEAPIVAAACMLDASRAGVRGLQKELVTEAFRQIIQLSQQQLVDETIQRLAYNADCVDECDKLLKFIHTTFEVETPLEDFISIMKHAIFLAKKNLSTLQTGVPPTVTYYKELFLNFQGAQGIGKTQMLKALLAPLGPLVAYPSLDDIVKSPKAPGLIAEKLGIFIDELGRVGGGDSLNGGEVGRLKDIVSKTEVTYVPLYSNSPITRPVVSQFFSATNETIFRVINDDDNRRFFEIPLKTEKALHALAIEYIRQHAFALWQGVDESLTNGYFGQHCGEVWTRQREVQRRASAVHSSVGRFAKCMSITAVTGNNPQAMNYGKLWKEYRKYCKDWNVLAMSRERFERCIHKLYPSAELFVCAGQGDEP